jgi:hypothetical protein
MLSLGGNIVADDPPQQRLTVYETTDRSEFVCANEQYYLMRDNLHTCWACADGDKFIDAAIKLWNEW